MSACGLRDRAVGVLAGRRGGESPWAQAAQGRRVVREGGWSETLTSLPTPSAPSPPQNLGHALAGTDQPPLCWVTRRVEPFPDPCPARGPLSSLGPHRFSARWFGHQSCWWCAGSAPCRGGAPCLPCCAHARAWACRTPPPSSLPPSQFSFLMVTTFIKYLFQKFSSHLQYLSFPPRHK